MSLVAVTKKEFLDSIRSYTLLGLIGLSVVLSGFWSAIQWIPEMSQPVNGNLDMLALLNSMRQPALYLIPMIGIVVGYKAIAGERDSGSIKLLLALPNTRREVFLGKVIGQTAVVSVAILTAYGTAAIIAFFTYDSFSFSVFVTYTLLSALYALVCVSIAVSFSAVAETMQWALFGAISAYLVILVVWDAIGSLLTVAFVGYPIDVGELPSWIAVFLYMNPSTAFAQATRAAIPVTREITSFAFLKTNFWVDWYGFIVMGLWIVIPLALSYLIFRRADIE